MAVAFGVLRLPPAQFWSMTPRELAAAFRGAFGHSAFEMPFARADLARLMQRFPDLRASRE
jgi:uncharacterized phage protein (TIGR02216 family)